MLRKTSIATASAILVCAGLLPANAAISASSIDDVLAVCPDSPLSATCVPAVDSFIANQGASDPALKDLVLSLSDIARQPKTTLVQCRDIADGVRRAAQAMHNNQLLDQTMTLADSLCHVDMDTSALGELSGPKSISTMGGNKKPPPSPTPPIKPVDPCKTNCELCGTCAE